MRRRRSNAATINILHNIIGTCGHTRKYISPYQVHKII